MGGLEVLHPLARSWATPLILPPSPPLSPSPVSSFRHIATDVGVAVAVAQAPCLRLYSQPSFPSSPVQVMRQVSVPVFATQTSPTASFPSTPRVAFRDFQPMPRGLTGRQHKTADSPRNTIQRDVVAPTPPNPPLPVKIRIATALLKKRDSLPATETRHMEPIPSMPTLLRSKGAAAKKHLELNSAKAEEIRSWERKWREAAAEQRRLEAERLRLEAERQRAQLQHENGSALRRQNEQRRESLAEDLRRLAEEKRRVRREEAEEVERKRAEAQRSRQEAASRRLHRKLLLVEEKHRLAEEARRAVEEGRRRRFNGDAGKATKAETARGRRFSETHSRPSPLPGAPARRRAKSADADEAERRKVEEERQRLEEEEAERRRLRWEQLQRLAEESKKRIEAAGCAWHVVLNVPKDATLSEVKQAFRDLALLHHPDKGLESCNETFRIVRGAYQRALAFFQEKEKVEMKVPPTSHPSP